MEVLTNFINTYGNEASFVVAAFIGGVAHYLKKSLKGETSVEIHEWFGPSNLQASLYTFIMFFFVIAGSLAGGIIDIHTPFWAALYTGFVTGYTIDSGFNSDGNIKTMGEQLANVKSQVAFIQPNHSEIQEHHIDQAIQSISTPKVVDPPAIAAGSPPPKMKVVIKH
jgi:hypothetical protein